MAESVTRYVRDRAGDAVRGIARYDESGYTLEYTRSDLDHGEVDRRVAALYEEVTWDWNPPEDQAMAALGDAYATLEVRAEAVIITLRIDDDEGLLLSLAPSVTNDLVEFLGEVLDRTRPDHGSPRDQ